MLQNEIEILLTQIHLMELYIKQAQAAAANEAARHREERQAELLALRAALERKEQELKQYQTANGWANHTLNRQLHALQTRLENTEELLHNRDKELREANSELRSLRERMAHVESEIRNRDAAANEGERLAQRLQSELASLRRELEGKNAELLRFQATTKQREEDWQGQVHQLQTLLAEKQDWLQEKELEVERAKAEMATLVQRVSVLESAAGEARVAAAHELELARAKFQTDLDALQTQLRSKEETLQNRESALAAIKGQLQNQSGDLRRELRENRELLEHRQRELEEFQSQTVALQGRMAEIEAGSRHSLAAAAAELESVRQEATTGLAQLRAELEHKERLLAEQQSAVSALEESSQAPLRALQEQLSETESCLKARNHELETSRTEIAALHGRMAEIEASHAEAQALRTRELEQTRESFQAELGYLHAQINEKEHALQDRESRYGENERRLQVQISDLQTLLAGKQQELADRERELDDFRTQLRAQEEINGGLSAANERSQVALSEADALRQGLQSELANLRDDICKKEQSLVEREAHYAAAAESLHAQIQDLQRQLLDGQASLENKNRETELAQSEATALRAQIAQLEIALRTAESAAGAQAEQVREQLQTERAELRAALTSLEKLLQEREAAFASIEEDLNSAIKRLRTELAEKQSLLDGRDIELEHARSQVARVQQQNSDLEFLHRQTEKLLSVQGEQIRARIRTEVEALASQLREKDAQILAARSQLDESQAKFDSRVQDLQCELADKQLLSDRRAAEIEDLNSHINRLLEESAQATISLEQTEAALKDELARLRQSHEAEVTTLREELHRSRIEHEDRATSFKTFDDQHRRELSDLRAQLVEKETLVSGRERDLEGTRAELEALHEKLAVLQSRHRQEKEAFLSEANRTESALRAELTAKERSLAERDSTIKGLQDHLGAQTNGLQNEVTELRRRVALRNAELEETKAAAEPLRLRVAELERTVGAIEQTRREAQAAVAALQAELTLSAKNLRDQEVTAKQQAHVLQTEVSALRTEAREKHDLLESRNEELVRVKAELDKVQERLTELELNTKREQETAATETETLRTEFQAQIAYLQAELSQRDWALAEREAARSVEPGAHRQQHEGAGQRFLKPESSEKFAQEFILGEPQVTGTQERRLKNLDELGETVATEDGQRFAAVHQRRWHSGWRWKRRWKT